MSDIIDIMVRQGLAKSSGEATRLIMQGAVRLRVGKTKVATVSSYDAQPHVKYRALCEAVDEVGEYLAGKTHAIMPPFVRLWKARADLKKRSYDYSAIGLDDAARKRVHDVLTNPKRKSRMQRKERALSNALDHASANLDYDPDTGTDYGPMDKAQDFMEDIAQYFNAFETSDHDTIAGYAEAVADEIVGLRIKVAELQAQVDALEFAASTDVRVSSI